MLETVKLEKSQIERQTLFWMLIINRKVLCQRHIVMDFFTKMKATNDAKNIERRAKIKADGYLLSEERLPGVKYEVVYRLNNIRAYKKVE